MFVVQLASLFPASPKLSCCLPLLSVDAWGISFCEGSTQHRGSLPLSLALSFVTASQQPLGSGASGSLFLSLLEGA
jgi:hypothetical protein